MNPVIWLLLKFSNETDDFTHRGMKNGVRIAATLYLFALWIYLLLALLTIAQDAKKSTKITGNVIISRPRSVIKNCYLTHGFNCAEMRVNPV